MKRHHKITLGSLGATVAIIAGIFTIIEKTPTVINVISDVMKAEPAEVPDTVQVSNVRTWAGSVNKTEDIQKPVMAK